MANSPNNTDNIEKTVEESSDSEDEPEIIVTRFGGYPDESDKIEKGNAHVIDVPIEATMDPKDIEVVPTKLNMDSEDVPIKTTMDSEDIPNKTTMVSEDVPIKLNMDSEDFTIKSTMDSEEVPVKSTIDSKDSQIKRIMDSEDEHKKSTMGNGEERTIQKDDVKITMPEDSEKRNSLAVANSLEMFNNNQNISPETSAYPVHNCRRRTSSWRVSSFQGWTKGDIKWLEKSEARFREIAGNKGCITFEQFTKALGVKKTSFYAERIFKLLDQDDNGTIELGELFDGLHMLTKGSPTEKLKFLFDLYDNDGNGYIDYTELQEVLKACVEESSMSLTEENFADLTAAMFDTIDKDDNGIITFEELKETLEKQPEVLNNLTIGAANLLRPAETDCSGAYSRYLTKEYLVNNCRKVGYFIIYWLLNIVLFGVAMWLYRDTNIWMMLARGGGLCLNFNCMWVLVLMLRNCLTYIRMTVLSHVLPLDQHIMFHKMTAIAIVIFAIIHTLAHIANSAIVANANLMEMWEVLFTVKAGVGFVGGSAFITGWLLDIVLIIMVICSLPSVRRGGHFQVFYWTHLLYVPFWILVLLHGPHFWKWFVGPGVIFLLEKISRSKAFRLVRHGETFIKEVNLLPSRVIHLVIDRPVSFRYKPGDYLFIQIPAIATHEWHPFTISSAPEMEGHIWLHIRSAGHWTNKLYDYFDNLVDFDHDEDANKGKEKENNNIIEQFEKSYVQRATRMNAATFRSKNTSPKHSHKKVSIKCFLDGPYGTGTREVFDSEHVILVGAGIGITPMASILQSVWYKFSATRKQCPNCEHVWLPDDNKMTLKKVDFIWVNRDQKCFEWFVSLLKQIEHEQNQHVVLENRIQVHMYMTSAQKKTDMKGIGIQVALDLMYEKSQIDLITGLRTKTQPGRPDWDQIFKNVQKENKGKVKVFVCGPPTLAKTVKESATKHKFAFSKENF